MFCSYSSVWNNSDLTPHILQYLSVVELVAIERCNKLFASRDQLPVLSLFRGSICLSDLRVRGKELNADEFTQLGAKLASESWSRGVVHVQAHSEEIVDSVVEQVS